MTVNCPNLLHLMRISESSVTLSVYLCALVSVRVLMCACVSVCVYCDY